MKIPSQTEMFQYLLKTMVNFDEFSRRQAKDEVCQRLELTEAEQAQKTDSGVPVYESRTGWAITWLMD